MHDLLARILKAIRIEYNGEVVSGDPTIEVAAKLQYTELFPVVDDGDLIYKAYVDGLLRAPETIDVPDSTPIVIDWQNDEVPSGDQTWAEKFGNDPFRFQGWFGTTTLDSYTPNIKILMDGADIDTVTINDIFEGKIIIA